MRVFCYLLLYVHNVASVSDKELEIQNGRRKILEQLTKTRTVLLDDYHLVTRQIATEVYTYRSYRTVNVVLYPIKRDVVDAQFKFQAEEIHMNNIGSCQPQEIIINLKHGSFPAVNPDGYKFPKDFIDPSLREPLHTVHLLSDGKNTSYSIKNPRPGNWYALIYIKWEDPRTQKVEQQGLVPHCNTILYTDLQVKRGVDIQHIDCYSPLSVNDVPANYKCMSLDNIENIKISITVTKEINDAKILFSVQALSLPTKKDNLVYCVYNPHVDTQTITFKPNPGVWHYIHIDRIEGNASQIADCDSYVVGPDDAEDKNFTLLDLMRDDKGRFFTFDYGLPTVDIQDITSVVNLTSGEIKILRFNINQFIDVGGSFTIEAILIVSLKYFSGYRREVINKTLLEFTADNPFIKVVICMDIGYASEPLPSGHCKYNDRVKPALFELNSTDSETVDKKVIIPFPDSGTWYLSFRLFCDDVVCPCSASQDGNKYYVDLQNKPLDLEDILTNATYGVVRIGGTQCSAAVLMSISSGMCVGGRCHNYGNCLLNTFGGLVMSFCSCPSGYGGWDCSDSSRMDSRAAMLLAVLLLTLSNLLFLLSVYVAVIRLYHTEAMMYAFTMVFSTFYHACDAPPQVAYCIAKGNILQFGDFYCGIMSFWVTLLAMSIVGEKCRSSLQLTGAIIVAILTTWNMHSFIAFLLPVAVAMTILIFSWLWDYRITLKMRYPKSYYCRHLPIGLVLVSLGLICYAFLQTEQNYKVVHSLWHMIIAGSVSFLLPDVKREGRHNPFMPVHNFCKLFFCKFRRPQVQNVTADAERDSNQPITS